MPWGKSNTLALIAKATEPYANHALDVTQLNQALEAQYAHEQGRVANSNTVKQWDLLIHGNGIWPRFVARWKAKSVLSPAYISDKSQNVGEAFDSIISLENAKKQ